jgi:hypothetical protein
MTTEDIIRLAREAGLHSAVLLHIYGGKESALTKSERDELRRLERFAALLRDRMIADGWRQCAQGQKTTQWCAQAADRLARHGIQIPEDEDGNPSF